MKPNPTEADAAEAHVRGCLRRLYRLNPEAAARAALALGAEPPRGHQPARAPASRWRAWESREASRVVDELLDHLSYIEPDAPEAAADRARVLWLLASGLELIENNRRRYECRKARECRTARPRSPWHSSPRPRARRLATARPRERRAARTASSGTSSPTSSGGDGADGPPPPPSPPPQRPPSSGRGVSLDRLPIPPRPNRGGRRDSGLSRDALLTGSPGVALSSTPDRAPVALNAASKRPGPGAPVTRPEGVAAMFDRHRAEGREGSAEVRPPVELLERSAARVESAPEPTTAEAGAYRAELLAGLRIARRWATEVPR